MGLGFVWLQKSIDAEETIIGKKAFENFCLTHGVHVKHYHADNGISASNAWKESCKTSNQGLSFASVNAHHQNGVAKQQIWELQEMAWTMLLHGQHCWPQAVMANLWPYAVWMACNALNHTPQSSGDKLVPLKALARVKVTSNP